MAKLKVPKYVQKLLKDKQGIKLDLGAGGHKQPGFVGVDIRRLPGIDIVQDLEKFPWPLPNDCASFAMASHVVEHINPAQGIFLKFMDEVWRVLKEDAQFIISLPYGGSPGYWQDPTHVNGCNEATWYYFDPEHESKLWGIYKPKPWKIMALLWDQQGFMEVCLVKRLMKKEYENISVYPKEANAK